MSAGARGFAVFRSGWTGSVTVTASGGTVVNIPPAHSSVLSFASSIVSGSAVTIGGHFGFSVSSVGRLVFSSENAFALSFSGNSGTRLGFSSGTASSVGDQHADTDPTAAVFEADAMRYTMDVPISQAPGFALYGRSITTRTPGTDWKIPDAQLSTLRPVALAISEAFELADTPGKISILIDPSTVIDHHLGRVKIATDDEISGWTSADIEVVL